jgi:hypothetical protein
MPEFLMAAGVAALFCLVGYQQIRYFIRYLKRSFSFTFQRPTSGSNPYRDNPEVERDRYREQARLLAIELQQARDELQGTRMERDLAIQDRDLRVLKGRLRLGSAFAVGVLTCFTSVNVAPQIASDMMAERPTHVRPTRLTRSESPVRRDDLMIGLLTMSQRYYPYAACAPDTCCHRTRLRLVAFGGLDLRLEPAPLPIQFFWLRPHAVDDVLVATSGGEMPPSHPQTPQPMWIERYALPNGREHTGSAPSGVITVTLN